MLPDFILMIKSSLCVFLPMFGIIKGWFNKKFYSSRGPIINLEVSELDRLSVLKSCARVVRTTIASTSHKEGQI